MLRWLPISRLSWTSRVCDVSMTWHVVGGGDADPYDYAPWNPDDRQGWVLGCVIMLVSLVQIKVLGTGREEN